MSVKYICKNCNKTISTYEYVEMIIDFYGFIYEILYHKEYTINDYLNKNYKYCSTPNWLWEFN